MLQCTPCSCINDCLKGEVSIVLCFQLYSTFYTAIWINNCLTVWKEPTAKSVIWCSGGTWWIPFVIEIVHNFHSSYSDCRVSKDEWNIKKYAGKSMRNTLYVWQKAPLRLKWHWRAKRKIKPLLNYTKVSQAVGKFCLIQNLIL